VTLGKATGGHFKAPMELIRIYNAANCQHTHYNKYYYWGGSTIYTEKGPNTSLVGYISNNLLNIFKDHNDDSKNNKKTDNDLSRMSSLWEE
jgi:hypothetical protein